MRQLPRLQSREAWVQDMKPSSATVLELLQARYPDGVSAIELDREHGIYRAAARIYELKAEGWQIETRRAVGMTAVYRLLTREPWTGTLGLTA